MDVPWLNVVSAGIAFSVGWFLKQFQVKAEIGKLKAEKDKLEEETIKYAGDNLAILHDKRNSYNEVCEISKQIALKLLDELKGNAQTLPNTREDLCTAVHNKAIPAYVELIEFEQLLKRSDPRELKTLIAEEIVAELRRIRVWLKIINNSKFLIEMKLSPAKISKRTLSPFLHLLKDLPSKDDDCTEAMMLKNAINDIINDGFREDN